MENFIAFTVGTLGFFQCERMPFGLCNLPAIDDQLFGRVELFDLFSLSG